MKAEGRKNKKGDEDEWMKESGKEVRNDGRRKEKQKKRSERSGRR